MNDKNNYFRLVSEATAVFPAQVTAGFLSLFGLGKAVKTIKRSFVIMQRTEYFHPDNYLERERERVLEDSGNYVLLKQPPGFV